jgi:hypothetical protein
MRHSISLSVLSLLPFGYAIIVTDAYVQLNVSVYTPFFGPSTIATQTRTYTVFPTADITGTPLTSTVTTADGIAVTQVIAAVASDLPVPTTTSFSSRPLNAYPATPTYVFAPMVVTPPASCTGTSFRFTTAAQLPSLLYAVGGDYQQILDQIPGATTTTVVTDLEPDETDALSTSFTATNIYLPSGVAAPELPDFDAHYLGECYDPRRFGCPQAESTALIAGCKTDWKKVGYPLGASATEQATGRPSSTNAASQVKGGGKAVAAAAGALLGLSFI